MAVNVNKDKLEESSKDKNPETMFIPAGNNLARLVSYIELGEHYQMFKGQRAKYEQGKNAGRYKPQVLHVALTFEFPLAEKTGDYPLTISTTRRMDNGEFFDAVVVPASLADGTLSKGYAMKTKFMKFLTRLQEAAGKDYTNFAKFATEQTPVMIAVTNKTKDDKTYANMKAEGIMAPRNTDPVSSEVTEYDVPKATGTYCPAFEWDAPTAESWKALKPWDKKTIKDARNFGGSPIDMLLQSDPTLDAVTEPDADQDQSAPNEPGKTAAAEDIPV